VTRGRDFEAVVLAHLDAAFNLARWLVRDAHAAEDIVQEACLRAYRYFASLRGDDARPWLLGIVRNGCFDWLERRRVTPDHVELDDELAHSHPELADAGPTPEALLERERTRQRVDAAIMALAPAYREVVVLRELEGLSYAEIAQIASVPIGTVMSRLSRARAELKSRLAHLRSSD
jgi:RNA polymerase sigma-70 factor (ECF subfamily)